LLSIFFFFYLTGAFKQRVAFQATELDDWNPPRDTPLVFSNLKYNEGVSYSNVTGYFTAPTAGVYYFIGSVMANEANTCVRFYLYVDNTQINWNRACSDGVTSVQGVVHLQAGQRVWVRSNGDHEYYGTVCAFTGFLLSPDL
jgi:hypothetical protein